MMAQDGDRSPPRRGYRRSPQTTPPPPTRPPPLARSLEPPPIAGPGTHPFPMIVHRTARRVRCGPDGNVPALADQHQPLTAAERARALGATPKLEARRHNMAKASAASLWHRRLASRCSTCSPVRGTGLRFFSSGSSVSTIRPRGGGLSLLPSRAASRAPNRQYAKAPSAARWRRISSASDDRRRTLRLSRRRKAPPRRQQRRTADVRPVVRPRDLARSCMALASVSLQPCRCRPPPCRPRHRRRVAGPAASRKARAARSASSAAASGDTSRRIHCVPAACRGRSLSPSIASSACRTFGGDRDRAAPRPAGALRPARRAAFICGKAFGNRSRDRSDVPASRRDPARSGRDHEIARCFGKKSIKISARDRCRSSWAESSVKLGQRSSTRRAAAIGTPGEIDMAVARRRSSRPGPRACARLKAHAERPDAHDSTVAAQHLPQGAGHQPFHSMEAAAPHVSSLIIAPLVSHDRPRCAGSSQSRAAQRPGQPPASAAVAAVLLHHLFPTASSTIRAACVASNR